MVTLRLLPNSVQIGKITRHLGSARFVHNWTVIRCRESRRCGAPVPAIGDLMAAVPELRRQHRWLHSVSDHVLRQTMIETRETFLRSEQTPGEPAVLLGRYAAQRFSLPAHKCRFDTQENLIHLPIIGAIPFETLDSLQTVSALRSITVYEPDSDASVRTNGIQERRRFYAEIFTSGDRKTGVL